MPYTDKDKQRAYQREWVRHKRQGSTSKPANVEPIALPVVEPEWQGLLTKDRQISRKGFND